MLILFKNHIYYDIIEEYFKTIIMYNPYIKEFKYKINILTEYDYILLLLIINNINQNIKFIIEYNIESENKYYKKLLKIINQRNNIYINIFKINENETNIENFTYLLKYDLNDNYMLKLLLNKLNTNPILYEKIKQNKISELSELSEKYYIFAKINSIIHIKYLLKIYFNSILYIIFDNIDNESKQWINNINKIKYRIYLIERLSELEEIKYLEKLEKTNILYIYADLLKKNENNIIWITYIYDNAALKNINVNKPDINIKNIKNNKNNKIKLDIEENNKQMNIKYYINDITLLTCNIYIYENSNKINNNENYIKINNIKYNKKYYYDKYKLFNKLITYIIQYKIKYLLINKIILELNIKKQADLYYYNELGFKIIDIINKNYILEYFIKNNKFYLNPIGMDKFNENDRIILFQTTFNNQIYQILKNTYNLEYRKTMPVDFIFIYAEYVYDQNKFNSKNSRMISLLSGYSKYKLTDKINFTKLFIKEPFIYNSKIINRDYIDKNNEKFIKIIKPDNGFDYRGIKIVKTNEEIQEYLKNADAKYNNFILQDYIQKPDLYNKLKFYLRVNIMVRYINNVVNVYLCKYSVYRLAYENFTLSDFDNKNIHKPTFYLPLIYPINKPDNYTDIDIKNINFKIINYIKIIFKNNLIFKPAWNALNGFELFGLDMTFSNKQPYFFELNEKMGETTYSHNSICIPNYIKSILELTYFEQNYDKYNNFIRII